MSTAPLNSPPVLDEGLRCLDCDYNLTGLPSGVCPECGAAFEIEELRLELAGKLPRPIPVWDEPQRYGRAEAFVRMVLRVWFQPGRFAATFPRRCRPWSPLAFSLVCHVLAYVTGVGLACLAVLDLDALIQIGVSDLRFLVVPVPAIAIMANLCELLIAAGPFALAGAGPRRRYRFLTVRRMLRFTTCHLILSCTGGGVFYALERIAPTEAGMAFWMVFGTSFALWWIDLSIILLTLGRRFVGVVAGILLIPVIGAAVIFLGYMLTAFLVMTFLWDH